MGSDPLWVSPKPIMGIEGALSRGVKCPDLNLATHCNLAHNLRIFGAIILFPQMPSWHAQRPLYLNKITITETLIFVVTLLIQSIYSHVFHYVVVMGIKSVWGDILLLLLLLYSNFLSKTRIILGKPSSVSIPYEVGLHVILVKYEKHIKFFQ